MTDDINTPFKALADKLFPGKKKEKDAGAPKSPGLPCSPVAPDHSGAFGAKLHKPAKQAEASSQIEEDDADQNLFLDAVSRVKKLGRGTAKAGNRGSTLADDASSGFALLAGLLPSTKKRSKRSDKRQNKSISAFPAPGAQLSDPSPPRADDPLPHEIMRDVRHRPAHTFSAAKSASHDSTQRGKSPAVPPGLTPQSQVKPQRQANPRTPVSMVLADEAAFSAYMLAADDKPQPESEAKNPELALFEKAMHDVAPISAKGRELSPDAVPGKKTPDKDPAQALRDFMAGKLEFALHHTDEYLEGFVVGVDPMVINKLRAGEYSPEAHLDLHGQNADQAFNALFWFIKSAYQRNLRTLLIVTGRGKNSPDGIGILRMQIRNWLTKDPFKRVVLAFCTAKPSDGGPGAIYVLLRKYKKGQGKIIWERTATDDDLFAGD